MSETDLNNVTFCGYYPGAIGKVTELHATYYHENWGFDVSFEAQVGKELSEFMTDFRVARDLLTVAKVNGIFAGAVAIDGHQSSEEGARLRWFIVDPSFQGRGLGQELLNRAIDFCAEVEHDAIVLWTFRGLDSARSLYERAGFRLTEGHSVSQWGSIIEEQKYERRISNVGP